MLLGNANDSEIIEIAATLDNWYFIDKIETDDMLMSSQNQIDSANLFSQLFVVSIPHMGQRDHHIALLLLSEVSHHLLWELNEVSIFKFILIVFS